MVLNVTYSLANLSLLLLGRTYSGEIPPSVQLASLVVALFALVFLVAFRKLQPAAHAQGRCGVRRPAQRQTL